MAGPSLLPDDESTRQVSPPLRYEASPSSSSQRRLTSPLQAGGGDGGGGDLSLSSLHLASSPEAETEPSCWISPTKSESIPSYPSLTTRIVSEPSGSNNPSPESSSGTERQALSEWTKRSKAFAPSRTSFESTASGIAYYSAEEDVISKQDKHSNPSTSLQPPMDAFETPGRTSSRDWTSELKSKEGNLDKADSLHSPPITARQTSLGSQRTPRRSDANRASASTSPSRLSVSTAGLSRGAAVRSTDPSSPVPPQTPSNRKGHVSSATPSAEPFTERSSSRHEHFSKVGTPPSSSTDETIFPIDERIEQDAIPTTDSGTQASSLASQPVMAPANVALQAQTDKNLLQRWILSIGVVNFDLEKGPDLERLWPPLDISREEKDNIAFSSFPDTSIFDVGDISFSFRIREVPLESSMSSPPKFSPSPSLSQVTISPHSTDRSAISKMKDLSRKSGNPAEPSLAVKALFNRGPSAGHSTAAAELPQHKTQASIGDRGDQVFSSKQSEMNNNVESEVTSDGSSIYMPSKDALDARQGDDVLDGSGADKEVLATSGIPSGLSNAATCKVSNSSSSSYLYGYTFFRQKRDATIRRGYFQKSLVILSHLPYVALFGEIAMKLGPLYFDHGEPILEAFSNAVTKWPNPSPGATLPLPMVGTVLWVQLPLGRQSQTSNATEAILSPSDSSATGKSLSTTMIKQHCQKRGEVSIAGSSEEDPLLASIPTTPLVEVFKEALADMWLVWECVLLAEPIFVIGPDPKACSEAVWHLLDICRPIPHAGDFRPFFTIHDYDFKHLAARKQPPAGTIIGCTNAFLAQACSQWPHVLRVGKAAVKMGTAGKYGSKGGSGIKSPGVAGGSVAGGGGPEHLPGFVSKRKRRISKDRPLLKKIMEMMEKGENVEAANVILRRYFTDITERFLAPLNRYISSLIPAEGSRDGTKVKPFEIDAFLASLKAHGTPLPIRSRSLPTANAVRQGLYQDFLRSPNFAFYLTERIAFYRTRNPEPASRKTRFEQGSAK